MMTTRARPLNLQGMATIEELPQMTIRDLHLVMLCHHACQRFHHALQLRLPLVIIQQDEIGIDHIPRRGALDAADQVHNRLHLVQGQVVALQDMA